MHPRTYSGLGILLFYSSIMLYLRSKCWRDPTSQFFQAQYAHNADYSAHRIQQALEHADQVALAPYGYNYDYQRKKESNSNEPELCIGIPSVSRQGISYLKSTLGSLQQGLTPDERSRLHFVVLIAHTNPTEHSDYGQPWLDAMTDEMISYAQDDRYLATAHEMEQDGISHSIKSKFDYSIVLEACERTGAPHILMVEDDVVFLDGWLHRTLRALEVAMTKSLRAGHAEFMYLRLFYYEKLRGWNYSESWPKYLASSLTVTAAVLSALLLTRIYFPSTRQHHLLTRNAILFITFILTPISILLFFSAGTQCIAAPASRILSPSLLSTLPWADEDASGVHLMPSHACCGQGLVFPRETVTKRLLPHLRNNTWSEVPTDSFVEEYADFHSEEMLRWALTPVVMQHVGGRSSHGVDRGGVYGGPTTPSWIWNFEFETNDAEALAREHREVVEGRGVEVG